MAPIKRRRSLHATKVHEARSHDLPLNAQVAAIEVDDPLALEAGEKIVALRAIQNDPLARLHSHHQIDEAQYRDGRAFQPDWERAERGPQVVDPTREYVDGVQTREPITEGQRQAVLRLNRAEREHRRRRIGTHRGAAEPARRGQCRPPDRLGRVRVSPVLLTRAPG